MAQKKVLPSQELLQENQKFKARIDELEETFRAIRQDEVDALIINTPQGDRVFTLKGADQSYRTLIEQMKEGAAMLSRNVQTVLYCNTSLANMLNLPLEKVTGRPVRDYITPSHVKAFDELLAECRKGKTRASEEINFQRGDGTIIPTIMSLSTVTVDGAEAVYAVVTDLTEHMEEEVKMYTKNLEHEIKQRKLLQQKLEESAVTIEEYANQMEELARERLAKLRDAERMAAIGQTAGMVGHDIRNPLQTMLGELYLAKQELIDVPDCSSKQQIGETLDIIEEQTLYINKIVSDLQDFAKPTKPEPTRVDFGKFLTETLKTIKIPKTITTSIKISEDFPDLHVDRSLTQRILTNLITNAIQAIPEKGEITIKATHRNDQAIIKITDTGTGIPDDIKQKIFQPLFTTKAKGQGFGLAVVKRFVEVQGGEITFESKNSEGTSFTLKLPTLKKGKP